MAKTDAKAMLAAAKKYHFWVLVSLAILIGLVGWWLATSAASDTFKKRESKLKGDLSAMETIMREQDPPNDKVAKGVSDAHAKLQTSVKKAWVFLFDKQEKNNPWPKTLGEAFLNDIRVRGPGDEIPEPMRETYHNFIKTHLPELLHMISARRPVAKAEAKPAAGEAEAPATAEPQGFVDWIDFERVEKRFTRWTTTPSSFQVRMAQEDLWVYEALLRVLQGVNKSASNLENAAIKRIDAMEIGQDAAASWSKATGSLNAQLAAAGADAQAETAEAGVPMEGRGRGAAPPPEGEPPADAAAGAKLTPEQKELLDQRYVDNKRKPLAADKTNFCPELKMMPVHLRLMMDQSKIADLLVECANSDMPIEVAEIRLGNAGTSLDLGAIGGAAAGRPGADPRAGGMGGRPVTPPGGGAETPGSREAAGPPNVNSMELSVDIFGTITIFNPPPQTVRDEAEGRQTAKPDAGEPSPEPAPAAKP